jgi:hypothetical protein
VRAEPAAGSRSAKLLDTLSRVLERLGNVLRAAQHQPTLVRVQSHSVPLSEHPLHNRGGLLVQMIVDEEECGVHVLAPEDIEQQRRRGWIGAVIVSEIDDW